MTDRDEIRAKYKALKSAKREAYRIYDIEEEKIRPLAKALAIARDNLEAFQDKYNVELCDECEAAIFVGDKCEVLPDYGFRCEECATSFEERKNELISELEDISAHIVGGGSMSDKMDLVVYTGDRQ